MSFFRALAERPYRHDFFHALRRVECLFPELPRIGQAPRPADEPIRLGQDPALTFAPATLSALLPPPGGGPPLLQVRFFGLLGPNGPMPLHLAEFARERALRAGDTALLRFLDLINHRFLALFYRAWAQARPTVSRDRPREDRFAVYVGSLFGLGEEALRERDKVADDAKLFYAGLLARQVRNRDGLEALLGGYFRLPVRIEEHVGHWMTLPPGERSRLGGAQPRAALGQGALLGGRVWDRQHKFRIHIGPLTLADYQRFLPGGPALAELAAWVRLYLGFELDWDLRLLLKPEEVPPPRPGERRARLGWSCWLGAYRERAPAADLILDPARHGPSVPPGGAPGVCERSIESADRGL
ncbi:type VI secretion system protein ImpH [Pseudoduganella namucuonensis]|uniref:Type VI secretion system protein ImpH n=1 Tax=Pseudoduganella namucuonensis TaxID=1035707 RepID=A0A1I7KPR1_9BURK|nr:type VI secretion system protein ImpH [Pseudoduganella namucuonensis]